MSPGRLGGAVGVQNHDAGAETLQCGRQAIGERRRSRGGLTVLFANDEHRRWAVAQARDTAGLAGHDRSPLNLADDDCDETHVSDVATYGVVNHSATWSYDRTREAWG